MSILSVKNLSKNYGRLKALKDVSFSVPEGSVFGILGPNGSGKTTLLGTITDIIRPTAGSYTLFDKTPTGAERRNIGTLLETPNFYHYLNAVENLQINAAIKQKGEENIPEVLDLVDLTKRKTSRFSSYSLGMKQRLAIASCLLGNPPVLVFDEPTNGLDPVGIAEIRELMVKLHGQGKTIIMASHLLDEVEKICTHVAILKSGTLITHGDVRDILANEDIVEISASDNERLITLFQDYPGISKAEPFKNFVHLYFPSGKGDLPGVNEYCFSNGLVLNHLMMKRKSLESRFFELTNN